LYNKRKMSVKTEFDLLVTSDPTQGALYKTSEGSEFSVNLLDPIEIPVDARNVKLEVNRSLVWNNFLNIKADQNDKIYITGPDKDDIIVTYPITIQQGSYDLNTISADILAELEVAGAKIEPLTLISLQADSATGRVEITLNYDSVFIDMRGWNTFHSIIGLNKEKYEVPVEKRGNNTPYSFLAPNIANFSALSYILIHSDIVAKGLPINGIYNQSIAQLLLDAPSGSLIVFAPIKPLRIDARNLIGTTLSTFSVWITNESNEPLNTGGENFSVLFKLSYERNLVYGE
jgi:hypothetical protein